MIIVADNHKTGGNTMKKICSILVIAIGITLFVIGYTTKIPSKNLTTFSILEGDKYSAIDEYVGGDAYNYIIGASLVSGKIAAAKIERVIFISTGSLIFSIGIIGFAFSFKTKEKKPKGKKDVGEQGDLSQTNE
jgi:hypothetical protein